MTDDEPLDIMFKKRINALQNVFDEFVISINKKVDALEAKFAKLKDIIKQEFDCSTVIANHLQNLANDHKINIGIIDKKLAELEAKLDEHIKSLSPIILEKDPQMEKLEARIKTLESSQGYSCECIDDHLKRMEIHKKEEPEQQKCAMCGKPVPPYSWMSDSKGTKRYCSSKCMHNDLDGVQGCNPAWLKDFLTEFNSAFIIDSDTYTFKEFYNHVNNIHTIYHKKIKAFLEDSK